MNIHHTYTRTVCQCCGAPASHEAHLSVGPDIPLCLVASCVEYAQRIESQRLSQAWTPIVDGTAVGPATVMTDSGITVTVLWSDTEGVVLDLQADAVLDFDAVDRLCNTLRRMIATPRPANTPPTVTVTHRARR